MNTKPENIDDLIASYLAGEASQDEIEIVERWRDEDDEHARYFRQLELIFDKASSFRGTIPFDTDEAWKKVRKRLPGKKTASVRTWKPGYPFLRIAAGIIILIVSGVFAYRFFQDDRVRSTQFVADRATLSDTLPDGTHVFLNRETKIQYSFDSKRDAHIAKLSGEAYFNIRHEGEVDFIVEAGGTFIKDIGTSFNVRAYPELNIIEVIVEEGEVLFYSQDDAGIRLAASEKGTYDKTTGKFTTGSPEPNATAYKTRVFTFNNNSLESVVKTLNGVYDMRLRIDEHLKNCRLTVSFNEESMKEIAHVIAETLGLSVEEKNDGIWLRGQGCGEAPSK